MKFDKIINSRGVRYLEIVEEFIREESSILHVGKELVVNTVKI